MNYLESLVLGIIQGITEFLPISSSGHLEIGKALFGTTASAEESLFLTLALHTATALSTLVVFRKEIGVILGGLFQLKINESWIFAVKIILSMITAVFIGLFFEEKITALFDENILLVGVLLLVTAGLLFWADRAKATSKDVGYNNAVLIGIVQAIAILPGISRSGATIATAVLLGIDRTKAARFSFLMVLPLIFGSMAKSILNAENTAGSNTAVLPLLLGFVAAFVTGIIACKWMIRIVQKSQLKYFSLYCALVGFSAILYELI